MAADFGDPWVLVETFGSVRKRVREQGQLQPVVMWEQWKHCDPKALLSSKAISLDSSAHCQTQGRRSGPQQSSGPEWAASRSTAHHPHSSVHFVWALGKPLCPSVLSSR